MLITLVMSAVEESGRTRTRLSVLPEARTVRGRSTAYFDPSDFKDFATQGLNVVLIQAITQC